MATSYIYTNITAGNTPITVVYSSTDCNDFTMDLTLNSAGTVISNNPLTLQIDTIPSLIEIEVNYDPNICDDFIIESVITSAEDEYCEGTTCVITIPYTISSTTCIIAPEIDYNCVDGLIIINYNPNYNYNYTQGQFFPANQPITVTVTDPLTGCTNSITFTAPGCCDDIIITPEYDCETEELTITLSGPGAVGVDILMVNINPPTPPNSSCPYVVLNPLYDGPGASSPLVIPQALCDGNYAVELIISLTNNCTDTLMLYVDCPCDCTDGFTVNYTDGTQAGCGPGTIAVTPTVGTVGSVILNNGQAEVNNVEICVDCLTTDIIIVADVSNSCCQTWGTPTQIGANPDNIYMSQGIQYLLEVLDVDNNNGINVGMHIFNNDIFYVNKPLGSNYNQLLSAITTANSFVNTCTPNICSTDLMNNLSTVLDTYVVGAFNSSTANKKVLILISDGILNNNVSAITASFNNMLSNDVNIVSIHNIIDKVGCSSNIACNACKVMKCLTTGSILSGTCTNTTFSCNCTQNNNFYFPVNSYVNGVNQFTFLSRIKEALLNLSDNSLNEDNTPAFGALFQTVCCEQIQLKIISKDCNPCLTISAVGSVSNIL